MKKRLLATIAAIVLIVSTVALTACGLIPTPTPPQSAAENDTYYRYADGKAQKKDYITLRNGSWNSGSFSGNYTLSGSSIKMERSDGSAYATGTLKNSVLQITVDGESRSYYTKETLPADIPDGPTKEMATVYFDCTGGTGVPEEMQFPIGEKFAKLPTPVREGYIFVGWYDVNGGSYTADSIVNHDGLSLIARWEKAPDVLTGYSDKYIVSSATKGVKDSAIKAMYSDDVDEFIYFEISSTEVGGEDRVGDVDNFYLSNSQDVQISVNGDYRISWYSDSACTTPNGNQRFTLNYGSNIQFVTVTDGSGTNVEKVYLVDLYLKHDYHLVLYRDLVSDIRYKTVRVEEGELPVFSEDYLPDSLFEFDKFVYLNGTEITDFHWIKPVTKDMALYATYKPVEMTVDLDGGTLNGTLTVIPSQANVLLVPKKEGHSFVGWTKENGYLFSDSNGVADKSWLSDYNKFDKLIAKFVPNNYYYEFDGDGIATTLLVTQPVCNKDGILTEVNYVHPDPDFSGELTENNTCLVGEEFSVTAQKEGSSFVAWKLGEEIYSQEATITLNMSADVSAYRVKWAHYQIACIVDEGYVTISVNGKPLELPTEGKEFAATVSAGSSVVVEAVSNSNKSFGGWMSDGELVCGDAVYQFEMPASDVNLSGSWAEATVSVSAEGTGFVSGVTKQYTVSFDLNSSQAEGAIADYPLDFSGNTLSYPKIPTWENHVFTGWYLDANCTEPFDFNTPVNQSVTLYAGWADVSSYIRSAQQYLQVNCYVYYTNGVYNKNIYVSSGGRDWYYFIYCEEDIDLSLDYGCTGSDVVNLQLYNVTKKAEVDIRYSSAGGTMPIHGEKGDLLYIRFYSNGATVRTSILGTAPRATKTIYAPQTEVVQSGQSVTLKSYTPKGSVFLGWYDNDTAELVSTDANYTFTMPNHSVNYVAKWCSYSFVTEDTSIFSIGDVPGLTLGEEATITARFRTGESYTFLGWYLDDEFVSNNYNLTFVVGDTDATYVAKYSGQVLTLEKNLDEAGTVSEVPAQTVFGKQLDLVATTNEGYVFDGWYLDGELVSDQEEFSYTIPATPVTLVATWTICPALNVSAEDGSATVTFDGNGHDLRIPSQTLSGSVELQYPRPEELNYSRRDEDVFTGWYTEPECINVFDFSKNVTKDITLYAGWKTDSDASRSTVTCLGTAAKYTTQSLIARISSNYSSEWYFFATKDETVTIRYNCNSTTYNVSVYNVTANAKCATPSGKINSGSTVVDMHAGDIVRITLWGASTDVYVSFDGLEVPEGGMYGFGTILTPYHDSKTTAGASMTINAETYPGCTFIGWFVDDELVSDELEYSFTMPSEDISFVAKWKDCPVSVVNDDKQKGSIVEQETSFVGGSYRLEAVPTYPYSFEGWFVDDVFVSENLVLETTIGDPICYTAKWALRTLTVSGLNSALDCGSVTLSFDSNGVEASVPQDQIITTTNGIEFPTLTPFAQEDKVFAGWYKDKDCTEAFDFSANIYCDTVVYAGWKEKYSSYRYPMDMFLNNSEEMAREINTTSITYSGENKRFFTAVAAGSYRVYIASGNGKIMTCRVAVNDNEKFFGSISNTAFTTYAQLDCQAGDIVTIETFNTSAGHSAKCYIEYLGEYPHGGVLDYNKSPMQSGTQITLSATPDEDYEFVGWFDGSECLSTQLTYTFEMPNKSLNLVAKSVFYSYVTVTEDASALAQSYTVTFDLNGGTGTQPAQQTVSATNGLVYPAESATLTKEKSGNNTYVFRGWFTKPNPAFSDHAYDFSSAVSENLTLYAAWLEVYQPAGSTVNDMGDASQYNSEDNAFVFPLTNGKFVVTCIRAVVDGEITIYYNMAGGNGYITIENRMTGTYPVDYEILGSYPAALPVVVNVSAGDIIMVSINSSYDNTTGTVYVTGNTVQDGGLAKVGSVLTRYENEKLEAGETILLKAVTYGNNIFAGWYDGDVCISTDKQYEYEIPKRDVTIVAKWN